MYSELLSATQPRRQLAAADPQTFVEGGGTARARGTLRDTEPTRDDLRRWFDVWSADGATGALLDKRALMIFGVGSEWVTDDENTTVTQPRPDGTAEELTVADWLERVWPTRQRDEWFIRTAQTCYWAGFSVWEPIPTQEGGLVPNNGPWHGFEYVHPPTIDAFWDDKGMIESWVQEVRSARLTERLRLELDADDIVHVTLNPKGRNPMGLSMVDRAWDEIQTFRQNKASTSEALQRFAYLGGQVKVGREDGPAIDDNELRRVKQRYRRAEGAKWLVTGHDIDMQPFDTGTIGDGINAIRDRDIQDLATALDVPLEWTNYAGDGLGTGKPAESRLQAFEAGGKSEQARMAMHAIEFAKRLIAESPFPDDVHIDLRFNDILTDQAAIADAYRDYRSAYTVNEMREKFGDGPVPDEADIDGDAPVQEDDGAGDGEGIFGGLSGGPDTGNRHLSDVDETRSDSSAHENAKRSQDDSRELEPWEQAYDGIFEGVVWGDETGRNLFQFDPEDVPAFAIENLREAVLAGALFEDIDAIPSAAREAVKATMLDSLEERHGWSVDSIRDNLMDTVPDMTREQAETIARTETASITNSAREIGYEKQFDTDEARFYWQGPENERTTEACSWLKKQTNPQHGGEPVTLERLRELVEEAPTHDADMGRDIARPENWVVHPNERHTFIRATGALE